MRMLPSLRDSCLLGKVLLPTWYLTQCDEKRCGLSCSSVKVCSAASEALCGAQWPKELGNGRRIMVELVVLPCKDILSPPVNTLESQLGFISNTFEYLSLVRWDSSSQLPASWLFLSCPAPFPTNCYACQHRSAHSTNPHGCGRGRQSLSMWSLLTPQVPQVWCPVTGQGAMGTNWGTGSSVWTWGRTSSLWGWRSTGTGCPWSLLLWRYSRPAWTRSSAACCRWPGFGRRVGLDDPQRSLPTPTILWFFDSVILSSFLFCHGAYKYTTISFLFNLALLRILVPSEMCAKSSRYLKYLCPCSDQHCFHVAVYISSFIIISLCHQAIKSRNYNVNLTFCIPSELLGETGIL